MEAKGLYGSNGPIRQLPDKPVDTGVGSRPVPIVLIAVVAQQLNELVVVLIRLKGLDVAFQGGVVSPGTVNHATFGLNPLVRLIAIVFRQNALD